MLTKIASNIGDSGKAEVRLSKNSAKIHFEDSGITYDLPLGDGGWDKDRAPGDYNVTLSKDNKKIISVRPVAGTYILKFAEFGNRVGGVPEPAIQRGGRRSTADGSKQWVQPDQLVFRNLLEVVASDRNAGLKVMYQLPYAFVPGPDPLYCQISAASRKQLESLETFFRILGFNLVDHEIPYSPNVLPWLERELKRTEITFLAKIDEKGFVSDLSVLPADMAPRAPKSKKSAK